MAERDPLAVLQAENARLIALLESHGIDWRPTPAPERPGGAAEPARLTPAEIVNAALEEGVHCIGLSILSGSHVPLVRDVLARMKAEGLSDVPVVVGGIIPPEDEKLLRAEGVAAVYTPKDYELNAIMADIVRIVEGEAKAA